MLDSSRYRWSHSAETVYTEYRDPRRDEWELQIRPTLKTIALSRLTELTGLSRRALIDYRTGRSRPRAKNFELITRLLLSLGLPYGRP